ncbi:unnamed protein product, partial [Linum tenue]
RLARQFQCSNLVLEVDCLSLIHKLKVAETLQTEIETICRSIRRLLVESGTRIWQHVKRNQNVAAHVMAHSETNWDSSLVWVDRPPIFFIDQLRLDAVTMSCD